MSINPIISPLNIAIKQSMQKWLILVIPHLMAIILSLAVTSFPLWLKVSLFILTVLSFIYYSRLHLFQNSDKSVLSIQQDSAKNWFVTLNKKHGEAEPKSVKLLPSSFISKSLIILNYRDDQRSNYRVLITPDSYSTNEFRHLSIRIKLTNIK